MSEKKTVELGNARLGEQRSVMETIVEDGVCPFCLEHLRKYHKKPLLAENDSWVLTENQWPYEGAGVHLLLILKRHIETLETLSADEWVDLGELVSYANHHFPLQGGIVGMRFGDPTFSGATVRHLHAQIVVPRMNSETKVPFQVPLWTGTRLT